MAKTSQVKRKKLFKKRLSLSVVLLVISMVIIPYCSKFIDTLLRTQGKIEDKITFKEGVLGLLKNDGQRGIALIMLVAILLLIFIIMTGNSVSEGQIGTMIIAGEIEIPVPAGQGQHGTSRFLTQEEIDDSFTILEYKKGLLKTKVDFEKIGLVFGMIKKGAKEIIYCLNGDIHTLIIGATRSNKTRGMIFQSIWLKSKEIVQEEKKSVIKFLIKKIFPKKEKAEEETERIERGKSFIAVDVKKEIYLFMGEKLKDEGMKEIVLDFDNPLKSMRYNYMMYINEAIDKNDISSAIEKTWDLVSQFVGIPKGEPLWTDGNSSVLASCILSVSMDAPKGNRNLPNVHKFIGTMCKEDDEGKLLYEHYLAEKDDSYPSKSIFYMAEIAPGRTRGSFFTSALATLKLFTNWNIIQMSSESDFLIDDIVDNPTGVYLIVPDEKTTYYPLVALFVNQTYVRLVEIAKKRGGRIPIIDFFLDEFGNFPPIPIMGTMLSAGAGRGLRFTLVIQEFEQLKKKYKEDYENIKANCVNLVYLSTLSVTTKEEISKQLDNYTVEVKSSNVSNTLAAFRDNTNISQGSNLQARKLLTPEEVGRLNRPYSLVIRAGKHPAIMTMPDLSKYRANKELGLGNEAFNRKIYMEREEKRIERKTEIPKYWHPLNEMKEDNQDNYKKEDLKYSYIDY